MPDLLIVALVWGLAWWRYRRRPAPDPAFQRRAKQWAAGAAVVGIALIAAIYVVLGLPHDAWVQVPASALLLGGLLLWLYVELPGILKAVETRD